MKALYFVVNLTFLVLLFSACKTTEFTPEEFDGRMLTFGASGGFTGGSTTYYLIDNGQFYVEKNMTERSELKKIKKKVVDQMFSNYDLLNFRDLDLNVPGNMTKTLIMKTKEDEKVIKWGGFDDEAPPNLNTFYSNLMNIAKKNINEKQ